MWDWHGWIYHFLFPTDEDQRHQPRSIRCSPAGFQSAGVGTQSSGFSNSGYKDGSVSSEMQIPDGLTVH